MRRFGAINSAGVASRYCNEPFNPLSEGPFRSIMGISLVVSMVILVRVLGEFSRLPSNTVNSITRVTPRGSSAMLLYRILSKTVIKSVSLALAGSGAVTTTTVPVLFTCSVAGGAWIRLRNSSEEDSSGFVRLTVTLSIRALISSSVMKARAETMETWVSSSSLNETEKSIPSTWSPFASNTGFC